MTFVTAEPPIAVTEHAALGFSSILPGYTLMFRLAALTLVVMEVLFASLTAAAANPMEAQRAIEAEYARLGAAISKKDLDGIRAIHASDYRELQIDGEERGLAEVMAEWPQLLATMLDPSLEVAIDKIVVEGDEAAVSARLTQSYTTAPTPTSKVSNRIEAASRDLWIKTSGGWKVRRSESLMAKIWIDGTLVGEIKPEPPLTASARAAVVRDLGVHARPFNTALAGNGFDDLSGLDQLVGDARIVALGEASHGTAEFFQMKHRLLEYLVEKKGFTVFAIEANWPEAEAADRYIKNGEGDAAAALVAMYFWTWQTAEVRAMLDWMRAYNSARGDRPILSFTGFDMQTPTVAEKRVLDFLGRLGGTDRDTAEKLYEGVARLRESTEPTAPTEVLAEEKVRCRSDAAAVLTLLEAKREPLLEVATSEEFRDTRHAAQIVMQYVEMSTATDSNAERDRAMAENVNWLVEKRFPGQKIVLWAHNGHVGTASQSGSKTQGMHLRDRFGERMVVLGFALYQGEIRAKRMTSGKFVPGGPVALSLAPAKATSVEAVLHETGLPRFILDFRSVPRDSALGGWLNASRPHRSIGAGYDPDQHAKFYVPMILPNTYDGIVFISQSSAAKPLE